MKILIAGDFCPTHRVADKIDNGDYASVLDEVKELIAHVDYSIVNFECPVCNGDEKPIDKCGPNLKCTEKGVGALKWAGFDCVTLANNHFFDYGKEGVDNTLNACEKYGIDTVGGGQNLQKAAKILYKEINGQKLAIINCCEHEFSIATVNTAGSNPLNPIRQYYAINEAKKKSNYVLVIVHGGHEHFQLPSPRMQEIYRFFIDAGADTVINHHQHCYSGYEVYRGKPIFYGLGNFCFDNCKKRNDKWNEGFFSVIDFSNIGEPGFKLYPYIQCNEKARIEMMNSYQENEFYKAIKRYNAIILNKSDLIRIHEEWMNQSISSLSLLFQPYKTRIGRSLFSRNILPSLLSREKKLELVNYINCESHLDRILYCLRKI